MAFIYMVISSFLERLRAYMQHYLNNPQITVEYKMYPQIFHKKRVTLIRYTHNFLIKY